MVCWREFCNQGWPVKTGVEVPGYARGNRYQAEQIGQTAFDFVFVELVIGVYCHMRQACGY